MIILSSLNIFSRSMRVKKEFYVKGLLHYLISEFNSLHAR